MPGLLLLILLAGMAGSLILVFVAGHNNKSIVLVGFFAGWVFFPYLALVAADKWLLISVKQRQCLIPIIAFVSIAGYAIAHFLPSKTPAAIFLLLPFLSLLVLAISVVVNKRKSNA